MKRLRTIHYLRNAIVQFSFTDTVRILFEIGINLFKSRFKQICSETGRVAYLTISRLANSRLTAGWGLSLPDWTSYDVL